MKKRTEPKASTGQPRPSKNASTRLKSFAAQPAYTAQVPPEWNEFFGLLNLHRVIYLIVGAHAIAVAGRPRATQDIDVLVKPSAANARRLAGALGKFGFLALAKESAAFAHTDRMATLGVPPLRIDIMTSISGVSFAQAWSGRVESTFGTHRAAFLGVRELIANKLAAARPKDLLDIELLKEVNAVPS
jgi:hypothetical protein